MKTAKASLDTREASPLYMEPVFHAPLSLFHVSWFSLFPSLSRSVPLSILDPAGSWVKGALQGQQSQANLSLNPHSTPAV